jgi:hypothetical protein
MNQMDPQARKSHDLDCEAYQNAYLQGRAGDAGNNALEAHSNTCQLCQRFVAECERILTIRNRPEPPPELDALILVAGARSAARQRGWTVLHRPTAWAIAAALVAGLFVAGLLLRPASPDRGGATTRLAWDQSEIETEILVLSAEMELAGFAAGRNEQERGEPRDSATHPPIDERLIQLETDLLLHGLELDSPWT